MITIGTMPAGNYYIGDPCYVIPDADWSRFCEVMNKAQEATPHGEYEAAIFEFDGKQCFVSPTNCGDGGYYDQFGNEYGVDAGVIGAIPWELVTPKEYLQHMPETQAPQTHPKPFKVAVTKGRMHARGKRIKIGNRTIIT